MTKYIVQGGHPLFGEVEISGAKNAAVAIIPAALLVDGVCRIENIPQISDVTLSLKILEHLPPVPAAGWCGGPPFCAAAPVHPCFLPLFTTTIPHSGPKKKQNP